MEIPNTFIIIIIIILIYIYYMGKKYEPSKSVWIKDLKVRTGDLIMFKSTNNFHSQLFGNYYTHSGLIVMEGDIPYVFEADLTREGELCEHDQQKDFIGSINGIFYSPLIERIKKYQGYSYLHRLKPDIQVNEIKLREFIRYAVDNMYYQKFIGWNFLAKCFGENLHQGTNCGEVCFLAMVAGEILDQSYMKKYIPYHLKYISNLDEYGDAELIKVEKYGSLN